MIRVTQHSVPSHYELCGGTIWGVFSIMLILTPLTAIIIAIADPEDSSGALCYVVVERGMVDTFWNLSRRNLTHHTSIYYFARKRSFRH